MHSVVFAPGEYAALRRLAWEEWILDPKLLERSIAELRAWGSERRSGGGIEWAGRLSDPVAQALCLMLQRSGSLVAGSYCCELARSGATLRREP